MKLVIGLIGEKGAGKSTFAEELRKRFSGKRISYRRFSDILIESLTPWAVIEINRENLQKFPIIMEQAYGKGILTQAMYHRITRDAAEVVIADGVRLPIDIAMLRSFSKNILVYITANAEIRFNRIHSRKEKSGEELVTFEQFIQEEQAEIEVFGKLGSKADVKIENNGSLDWFKSVISGFYESNVKPALAP
jgi:dephospho-CoA kinase